MLKLLNVEKEYDLSVDIDDYVPINVEWKNVKDRYKHPITYWRTGDLKRSLLEIGLDSKHGAIRSLTLVLSSDNVIKEDFITLEPSLEGQPIFDISSFSTRYIDCTLSFSVIIMNNAVRILFSEQATANIVKSGHVLFQIGRNNELLSINIINLSSKELQLIKSTLNIPAE